MGERVSENVTMSERKLEELVKDKWEMNER